MSLNIAFGIEIFYPQINGVITTTMNLIKNLKKLGHNPIIFTPKVQKDNPEEIEGIPVYYIPSTEVPTYPGLRLVSNRHPMFKSVMQKHKINIVHTTAPWFLCQGLHYVAKKRNIPIINTFHTNLHHPGYIKYVIPVINKHTVKVGQKIVWETTKPALKPCDVLVAPSPVTCKDLETHFPEHNIKWISNGIDIEIFNSPPDYKILEKLIPDIFAKNMKYAIFIGRLAQEKSVDVLLNAVSIAKKRIPEIRLVLVGDGPKQKEYMQLAKNLDIEDNVRFLGKIDNEDLLKSNILQKARFFSTASTTEIQTITVIEALCCGTPLVVANHESMTFFTKGAAHYFEPNSADSLAQCFVDMWQDDKIYLPLKQEAEKMIDNFDGMHIAEQYVELYEEILAQRDTQNFWD